VISRIQLQQVDDNSASNTNTVSVGPGGLFGNGCFGSATTAGSCLLCGIEAETTDIAAVPTPTIAPPSTPGITWVLAASTSSASIYDPFTTHYYASAAAIYYAAAAPSISNSTATTVVANSSSTVLNISAGFVLVELGGVVGTSPDFIVGPATGASGTAPNPGTITLTNTDFVMAAVASPSTYVVNSSGGWSQFSVDGSGFGLSAYMLNASPGTLPNPYSGTAAKNWGCVAVGFRGTPSVFVSVTGVSPSSGPIAGGTPVTITGTDFLSGATVDFGGAAATSVVVVSSTQITCVTPAHAAGPVNVSVTDSDGTGTLVNGFLYVVPTVTNVVPASGPIAGGTPVTITGTYFLVGASVDFGGAAGTSISVLSSTQLTCITPPHALGSVTVSVTDADGTGSLPNGFTYTSGGGGGPTGGSEYMFVYFPDGVTEIDFTPIFPPTKKQPEEDWGMEAVRHDSLTETGIKKSQLDRLDSVSQVSFPAVALSDMAAWKAFEAYALTGGIFFYRPNIGWADDTGYLTCSLLSMDWRPLHKSFQIFSLEMKLRLEAPEAGS
jgi:hypothetical protein